MSEQQKVILITGSARRIGAAIATHLQQQGYRVVIHYHQSQQAAKQLADQLNQQRADSAAALCADLTDAQQYLPLITAAISRWGRLDALVNNASAFFTTEIATTTMAHWHTLLASNLQAPFFLAQAAAAELARHQGSIINISDIHARKPLKHYSVYCIAKAGLDMLTKSLARELAPAIRVNAIAPGAIAWPEESNTMSDAIKQQIIDRTPLKTSGKPLDIAQTVYYLLQQPFITGQIINVDGGRGLT